MKAAILTIGDEILIGQIVDTNSGWIARQLNDIGAQITRMISVSDQNDEIKLGISQALSDADVVLCTGGLGPTKDDITKKAIAEYFDDELAFHQETYERIIDLFEKRNIPVREAHRLQCFMPSQAKLLHNALGTAPGMWIHKNGKALLSMPGIPFEMKSIMTDGGGLDLISETFASVAIAHRTIHTSGTGESTLATSIASIERELPPHIKLAYLPSLNRVRLRLSGTGDDQTILENELDQEVQKIKALIPDLIFGYGTDSLEAAVGRLAAEKGLFIGTCESCTGGYLSHKITSVPGSSRYYAGSIITYSYELKTALLGVAADALQSDGAVNENTVRSMVKGGLSKLRTDIVIAISGIAGPGGGSDEKPVGTIWLAVGNKDHINSERVLHAKSRQKNIEYASYYALNMIRKFILKYY